MAVQHNKLKIAQVVFYQKDSLSIHFDSKNPVNLSVDRQALVMLREIGDSLFFTITDPNHSTIDTTIIVSVNRKLSGPNCSFDPKAGVSRLAFTHSAQEVYAGKPKSVSYRMIGSK
jgi:hypothetical protein